MAIEFECSPAHPNITYPTTIVYAVFFGLVGLLAFLGNVLALSIFLRPEMRSRSNSILVSLAISDTLVGVALCPLTVYQLVDIKALTNCIHEHTRDYFSMSLLGTSAMNVGYVAYDRYILLTRANTESSRYTKTIVLLVASWIIPPAVLTLKQASVYPSIIMLCMIFSGTLVAQAIFYCLISKAISKREKHLFQGSEGNEDQLQNRAAVTMQKAVRQRNVRLAKQVMVLVVFYMICMIPAVVALLFNMIYVVTNTTRPVGLQDFFLFALLAASANSCINPIIYASKYPEVRKRLREMFHKSRKSTSVSNITQGSIV